MNEQQLTKAVTELLQVCGWYVIRTHRPGQWATQKGVSDLIAISQMYRRDAVIGKVEYAGCIAFIELKGPRSKTSTEQIAFLEEMKARGHIAFVAEDIETVVEKLNLNVMF